MLGSALGVGGALLSAFGGSKYNPSQSELLSDAVFKSMRQNVLPKAQGAYNQLASTPMSNLQQPTDMFGNQDLYALQQARGKAVSPMGHLAGFSDPQRQALQQMSLGNQGFSDPFSGDMFNQYLQKYQDPYQDQVIDATLGDIREQSDIARSRIGEGATQAGGFGGSRQALENALLEGQTQKNIANVGGQLRQQGLSQAMDRGFRDYLAGQDIYGQGLATQMGAGDVLQQQSQKELDVARGFQTQPLEWYQQFLRGFPAQASQGTSEPSLLSKIGGGLMAGSSMLGGKNDRQEQNVNYNNEFTPWGARWSR